MLVFIPRGQIYIRHEVGRLDVGRRPSAQSLPRSRQP